MHYLRLVKKWLVISLVAVVVVACTAGRTHRHEAALSIPPGTWEDTLRYLYSRPASAWPKPIVGPDVKWSELSALPEYKADSTDPVVKLGKILFFDPRMSEGGKISCASCHQPALSWTDGRARSLGHDDQPNKRNSPTILNTWFYTSLFWDGRSHSLEDQAFSPINSETEMHSDMPSVITRLRGIDGYRSLFDDAFRGEGINPETITQALAAFQRTLRSRPAAFDRFVNGDLNAMTDEGLRGLHLFRTTSGCMNCHHGLILSDNDFHLGGLPRGQGSGKDEGRFDFSRDSSDLGKFRTPGLRDVTKTGPWMHNGSVRDLETLMTVHSTIPLTRQEKLDLIAFLESISTAPPAFTGARLPD